MYQWFHGGILLPGGTTPTLTLNDVRASDEGDYMCRVSNVAGTGSRNSIVTGEFVALCINACFMGKNQVYTVHTLVYILKQFYLF